jgi:hypothetical protein
MSSATRWKSAASERSLSIAGETLRMAARACSPRLLVFSGAHRGHEGDCGGVGAGWERGGEGVSPASSINQEGMLRYGPGLRMQAGGRCG